MSPGQYKQKRIFNKSAAVIEGKEMAAGKLQGIKPSEKKSKGQAVRNNDKDFDLIAVWEKLHAGQEVITVDNIEINNKKLAIINKDQEYWLHISKWDVMMYYASIAGYLLPYLKDRPIGLRIVSKWAGEEKETNFIRNMKGYYPSWVDIFSTERRIEAEGKTGEIDWVLCNNEETLIYLLNLGAIDFHPWASRVKSYEQPDYIVIDLDAKSKNAKDRASSSKKFKGVIKVAQTARQYFDEQGLTSFVKLSGKTGMHILLPCKGIPYDSTRRIAQTICDDIHQRIPKISTSVHAIEGKIYIDPSQNDYSDRLVAPYCVRAYKQPYVSAPLTWDEVNTQLDRNDFKMSAIKERLERSGDLFESLLDEKIQKLNTPILKHFLSTSVRNG